MLTFSSATVEVKMMNARTGKLWGALTVGLSWEGRDAIAAKALTTKGLPFQTLQSEVLGYTFAHNDYTEISRRIGLV